MLNRGSCALTNGGAEVINSLL